MDLIPSGEAGRRLRVSGRSYLGIREIPVARIVGSVDRSADETVDFDAAAAHARELKLPRSRKRHHLRESRRPLPRRGG